MQSKSSYSKTVVMLYIYHFNFLYTYLDSCAV